MGKWNIYELSCVEELSGKPIRIISDMPIEDAIFEAGFKEDHFTGKIESYSGLDELYFQTPDRFKIDDTNIIFIS